MTAMGRLLAPFGAAVALALLLRRLLRAREASEAGPVAPGPGRTPRPDSDDPLERIESQVVASERGGA
jgi:hypothetical protein